MEVIEVCAEKKHCVVPAEQQLCNDKVIFLYIKI